MPSKKDLKISILSSFITGLMLMFITWGINLNTGADAPGNLSIAFGAGLGIGFFGYVIGLSIWAMWMEKIKNPPEQVYIEEKKLTVIQDADTNYSSGTFELPEGITVDHMIELARQVITLKSDFSHAALSGPGRPFSRGEYESMRKYCQDRKWIRWNNEKYKRQGIAITKMGYDAFKQLLSPYPTSVFRLYGYDASREPAHTHTRTQGAE